jgi:hypothetical protein
MPRCINVCAAFFIYRKEAVNRYIEKQTVHIDSTIAERTSQNVNC